MADLHIPQCTIVAVDSTSFCYRVCGSCERVLPEENTSHGQSVHPCEQCRRRPPNPNVAPTKHLYRLLISIATEERAIVVVAFDRAAKGLFGCSADEFLRRIVDNGFTAEMASKVLEGEMVSMVLRPPKKGYGQHLRAVSIVPISSSFEPVIATLPRFYPSGTSS